MALQVALEGVGAAQTWALRGGLTEVELVLPPQAPCRWVRNLRAPALALNGGGQDPRQLLAVLAALEVSQ